jgi:hypothetical protein
MNEHTKEPWRVEYMGSDEADVIGADDTSIICRSTGYMSDINARRIVACVNACAGIDTESLEADGYGENWKEIASHRIELMGQRDELLEVLIMVRDADEDCRRDGLQTIPPVPRAKIDAAIARVENTK